MLLNAVWAVPEELKLSNLEDRTILVDTKASNYAEVSAWGEPGIYSPAELDEPQLLSETEGDHTRFIALNDKPLLLEFWDTTNERRFVLRWDGIGWCMNTDEDFPETQTLSTLRTIDVEHLYSSVLNKMGLSHLTPAMVRGRNVHIEIVNRSDFGIFQIRGDAFYYRDTLSNNVNYTVDKETIPDIDELDMIQCVSKNGGNEDTVYVFYNEDEIKDIIRCLCQLQDKDAEFEYTADPNNPSTDIVDMRWDVKTRVAHDGLTSHIYLLQHVSEEDYIIRLFINMERFYPEFAPYLVQP